MFYVPSPTPDSNPKLEQEPPLLINYEFELERLYNTDVDSIRSYALTGNLSTSKLRSVYWRILLGVIPSSSPHWLSAIQDLRKQYDKLKCDLTLNPHQSSLIPDDNPLSQDSNSVWFRYFCDEELKRVIQQDVIRTSPEKQFFQTAPIQEIMVNVLFVYARQNPNMCYRQGMHELLASILFVIYEDCRIFQEQQSNVTDSSILHDILNLQYLEHDVFHLFESIMKRMLTFYESDNSSVPNACGHFSSLPTVPKPTSAIPEDSNNVSGISLYINTVIRNNLAVHDPPLYQHMKKLSIPFTAFGIRWLRLLFGREFPFVDLFVLWDAIFALNSNFFLVNHILTAMLIAIREKLLQHDYVECLNCLMKYPRTVEVAYIVKLALHLTEPTIYRKPSLPITKASGQNENISTSNRNVKNAIKSKAALSKRSKNIRVNIPKKTSRERNSTHLDEYSSKSFEVMVSELKHMRVVMSLCKLKLYQYYDILSASVAADDIKAQHALTGIHELCTLLEIDHFSLKSSPCSNPDVETASEAGEISPSYSPKKDESPVHPTDDAVALFLPPPNSEIDMTVFRRTERAFTDPSQFPRECPHKAVG